MKESYETILEGTRTEFKEKKSKFIGTIRPIRSEEDAKIIIGSVQKEYNDAGHHCFAYTVGIENPIERYSDDGEPSGTAGMPILDVIRGSGLNNILIIVTRYFGGVLLGTGGLTRAYSTSAKECIKEIETIHKILCVKIIMEVDYSYVGKVEYEMHQKNQVIYNVAYGEKVIYTLLISQSMGQFIQNHLFEITNGQAKIKRDGFFYYYNINGEYVLEKVVTMV